MNMENNNMILGIIAQERKVLDRVHTLSCRGYECVERRMGSGGVGQVKKIKGITYMQVGYGHGKYNYAWCVILKNITN